MNDDAKLIRPRDAAKVLGISYSTLKRWIHTRKLHTVKTQGGHHRVPERELDKHLHFAEKRLPVPQRRAQFRQISARNQLIGRILDIKVERNHGPNHLVDWRTADYLCDHCGRGSRNASAKRASGGCSYQID